MGGQPALGGIAFAVLLAVVGRALVVGVVLGLDEVRHERDGAVAAIGHDGGCEHAVKILEGLLLADMAGGTQLAVEGIGALELRAVQRNGEGVVEAQEGGQGAVVEFRSFPIADSQVVPAAGGQNFPDYL